MNTTKKYQILLTNDDGIQSPGLWTAAGAGKLVARRHNMDVAQIG